MADNKKILLILGGSSDLGCELICRTARDYDIILAHYNHMNFKLEKLKQQHSEKLQLLHADFMDSESIEAMIELIKEKNWVPDHIVHFTAGRFKYTKYEMTDIKEFELEMQVSLYSFIRITQSFIPFMKKKKSGKIVVTLTAYTHGVPPKFMATYISVKYAMLGLIKSLAADYADKGIQINSVSPEMIETKFLTNIPDFVKEQNAEKNPIKRNLIVEDVIPAYLYLLSAESNCVTGQNLFITGGR